MSTVFVVTALVILAIFIILRIFECVVRRDDKKKLRALYEAGENNEKIPKDTSINF
tara:strand:- start:315 stop:482 length:168 start_codon:yes stop_codon:yes gene_type:complete